MDKKLILIADDDFDYLYQQKIHLEGWGYEVIGVESRKEAEQFLSKTRPDLAILDLMMEEDDSGFILSRKLKQIYPDVPVIIATAVSAETGMSFGIGSESDRLWIKADRYLEKGLRPEQLKIEIEKLLK